MSARNGKVMEILRKHSPQILEDWLKQQRLVASSKTRSLKESEFRDQSSQFLALLTRLVQDGNMQDITTPEWAEMRELLAGLSKSRAHQGFSPSETATFVFSLKQPLFERLRQELSADELASEIWGTNLLLDKLGLLTTEIFQTSRDRKSTRLNSSHLGISYAVFCLKKKTHQ